MLFHVQQISRAKLIFPFLSLPVVHLGQNV